jgi:hypothetical protein
MKRIAALLCTFYCQNDRDNVDHGSWIMDYG